jgi:ribonuclease E
MEPAQELVYGWMGLSPALLLDQASQSDNLLVRVVRPGEDTEAVLNEARQQLAAAGGRRRRRGRGASDGGASEGGALLEAPSSADAPIAVEITPLADPGPNEPVLTVALPSRERRAAAAAATPKATPKAAAAAAPEVEVDDGEPRRRRRRSSAAG